MFRSVQAKPLRVQLEVAASDGDTRFGMPKSAIAAMLLPVPPSPHQRTIAEYLDRETARLDALVTAKELLLTVLAEKRQLSVTRAVTRGIKNVAVPEPVPCTVFRVSQLALETASHTHPLAVVIVNLRSPSENGRTVVAGDTV